MYSLSTHSAPFEFQACKKLVKNLLLVFFWCYTYIYVMKVQAINGGEPKMRKKRFGVIG